MCSYYLQKVARAGRLQMPHVLVLPEDDANRQLANGFLLDGFLSGRQMLVLEVAGGWTEDKEDRLDQEQASP